LDVLLNAIGLGLSVWLLDGLDTASGWSFTWLVVLIGLLNAVVKPLLVVFTLPFVIFTFGLGLWVINAVILMLAGNIIDGVYVDGFVTALIAAAIVSVVGFAFGIVLNPGRIKVRLHMRRGQVGKRGGHGRGGRGGGDVIDV